MYTWHESVVIKDRERDVQVWNNVKVYFKWGWNKSPFDSVVFHFDDFTEDDHNHIFFIEICKFDIPPGLIQVLQ